MKTQGKRKLDYLQVPVSPGQAIALIIYRFCDNFSRRCIKMLVNPESEICMKRLASIFFLVISMVLNASAADARNRPLIGITPSFAGNSVQLNYDYVAAINENGGLAIIVPPTGSDEIIESYVKMLDAAVFSGGPDIPPEFYGQSPHPTTRPMEPLRFAFEKRFIRAFIDSGKPVFGICLGMQFSNTLYGGSMLQDIPSMTGRSVRHSNGEMYTNFHQVGLARGSRLASILGRNHVSVISRHHQALQKVAGPFVVVARSSDGIIEAIERRDGGFGLFVQWHPESMKDSDPDHRNRLFSALVEASRAVRDTKPLN